MNTTTTPQKPSPALSLYHLLDPEVLANPYPLYDRLRTEDPVHWDPYLHAWVVTRYADVITVLHDFSADRTPTPEQFAAMGLAEVGPSAQQHAAADVVYGRARSCGTARSGVDGFHTSQSRGPAFAHPRHRRRFDRAAAAGW